MEKHGNSESQSRRRRPGERLPEEAVELIAAELKVMAVPNRIRLLELLSEGDATVQELADQLTTTHQNVSGHLGVLFHAGFVSRRREGPSVRYSLIDWTGWWVVEQIGRSIAERLEARRRNLGAGDLELTQLDEHRTADTAQDSRRTMRKAH